MVKDVYGKTIRLFLLEGNTNGLITAELSNWTGMGVKVPRIKIKEYFLRKEFFKAGVYILFGANEKNESAAYIGETEVIYERLMFHISSKEFWNEVIFFCSKDKYLNKASIKYLENRMHELANSSGRYKTDQNIPTKPGLSESEEAELDEFFSNIKTLTATLGHRIFEPLEQTLETGTDRQEIFICKTASGLIARGSPSTEGFVVFKDSIFSSNELPSLTESIKTEKKKMLEDGDLVNLGDKLQLTKHYVFNSSSRAATMVHGRSASGPENWKTEVGLSLKSFES